MLKITRGTFVFADGSKTREIEIHLDEIIPGPQGPGVSEASGWARIVGEQLNPLTLTDGRLTLADGSSFQFWSPKRTTRYCDLLVAASRCPTVA